MWKIWLWLKEAVVGIFKNLTSSMFAALLSFATLFLLAVWMIIGLNVEATSEKIEQNLQISLNLEDEVKEYKKLEEKIKEIPSVRSVLLITKEEAYERMKNDLGDRGELLTELGFNPLPASFEIKLEDPQDIVPLAKELEGWEEARSVKYGENYIDELMLVTENVSKGVYVIVGLIMVVSGLMIYFSIRLSIENRHRELAIKNLVGAGPFNIRIPFILEGVLITGLAVFLVMLVIYFSYESLTTYLTRLYMGTEFVGLNVVLRKVGVEISLIALVVGVVSSFLSTNKYIKNS